MSELTCYICHEKGHDSWHCPLAAKVRAEKEESKKKTKPDVGVSTVTITDVQDTTDETVDVAAITRSQQKEMSESTLLPKPEPRLTKTGEDWTQEERLRDSMFSELKKIQDEDLAQ